MSILSNSGSIIGTRVRDYSDTSRTQPAGTIVALSDTGPWAFATVRWDGAAFPHGVSLHPLNQLRKA